MAGTWGTRKATAPQASVNNPSGHSRLKITLPTSTSGSVFVARAPVSSRAIPAVAASRRPRSSPPAAAIVHQPRATPIATLSSSCVALAIATTASAVPAPANSRTATRRKSVKRTAGWLGALGQNGEHLCEAAHALDCQVRAVDDGGGPLAGADAHADGELERPFGHEGVEGVEGVEVGHVVAAVERDAHLRALDQGAHRLPLVNGHGRADLEHLAAPVDAQPGGLRLLGHALEHGLGGLLVG